MYMFDTVSEDNEFQAEIALSLGLDGISARAYA